MTMSTEDKIIDIGSDIVVDSIKYFQSQAKGVLTVFIIGCVTFLLWPIALDGIVPNLTFGQALALAFMGRLIAGPPNVLLETPLDAEERALLLREQVEENDGPVLRAIPSEDD